jgi:hypothetical protein
MATDTATRRVNPLRITAALDAIDATGPSVDLACGAVEPAVDRWEAGLEVPSPRQVELLAAYTGHEVEWFYATDPVQRGGYACARSGAGRGCSTVVDGVVVDAPDVRSARRRAERDAEQRATGWDPANDPRAQSNRMAKAVAIAEWMWHRDLDVLTIAAWDEVTRRRAARTVGVNPPHGDATWVAVAEGLARWEVVRTEVPREHLDEHATWCPGCDLPGLHPTGNGSASPLPVDPGPATDVAPTSDLPAAPTPGTNGWPKGWAALVASGPVTPVEPCDRWVDGQPCGQPAVVRSLDAWLCAGHPPQPGEWGCGVDWSPRPCSAPLRCYCGRCPLVGRTPSGDTVVDQQAIASGRRRSSPRRYAEARDALS